MTANRRPRTMRFIWEGEPPCIGHFLAVARPKVAYEVCAIRAIDPAGNKHRCNYRFTVERWDPKELPPHAVIHRFERFKG